MQTQEIDLSPVKVLLERIVARYQPLQIWLFGGIARGDAKPKSGWAFFVVVPDDTRRNR